MQLNKNVFYFSFHCTTRKNKTKLQKFVRFMNIMGYNIMMLSLFSVHSFLYYITFIISTPVHNVSLRSVFRFVRQSFDRCGHLSDVFPRIRDALYCYIDAHCIANTRLWWNTYVRVLYVFLWHGQRIENGTNNFVTKTLHIYIYLVFFWACCVCKYCLQDENIPCLGLLFRIEKRCWWSKSKNHC